MLPRQAGPGFVPRVDIRLIHAGDKWQEDTSDFAITQPDVGKSWNSAVNHAYGFAECLRLFPFNSATSDRILILYLKRMFAKIS